MSHRSTGGCSTDARSTVVREATYNAGGLQTRLPLKMGGSRPGDERQVLGEHYPVVKYYKDAAAFDALGCGGAVSGTAMKDVPAKNSPDAVGWPYAAKP